MEKKIVDGILLLDKPEGMTSNYALQKVKRMLCAQKAGHTGSLDPLATGVLPICFGEATKFSQFLLDADKVYQVTAKLGTITDSGDANGIVLKTQPVKACTMSEFLDVLTGFKGEIQQVPPMFSALKYQGQPLYRYARKGQSVPVSARTISIYNIDCLDKQLDTFSLMVHCSKGTYIRTLIEDIGQALGCGAHVTHLRRVSAGHFSIQEAVTLDSIETMVASSFDKALNLLKPISDLVVGLHDLTLTPIQMEHMITGRSVECNHLSQDIECRLVALNTYDGCFLGIGEATMDGRLIPKRLIRQKAL